MKKVITILMVLLALGSVAFAKAGFTVSVGGSYDFVNSRIIDETTGKATDDYVRGHALGIGAGVTYNFSDHFLAYYDGSFGFILGEDINVEDVSNFSMSISTTHHAGVAYDFNMDQLDLEVGAGVAFSYAGVVGAYKGAEYEADTATIGISSFGAGLYGKVGYKFSDAFSVGITVHPDFMFASADVFAASKTTKEDYATTTKSTTVSVAGAGFAFKCNAIVGVTFAF